MADPPDPPRYRAIQIDGPPAFSEQDTQAFGINCKGEVVGWAFGLTSVGFAWLPNNMYGIVAGTHALETSEGQLTLARAINRHGRVVGNAGPSGMYLWNLPQHGGGQILGTFMHHLDPFELRVSINDDDVMVGTGPGPLGFRLPLGGTPESLLPPSEWGSSFTITIGNSGEVGGWLDDPDCEAWCDPFFCEHGCFKAFCNGFAVPMAHDGARWTSNSSTAEEIEAVFAHATCPGCEPHNAQREPRAINSDDRIVGQSRLPYDSQLPNTCPSIATLWVTPDAAPMLLPHPATHDDNQPTRANAISDVSPDGMVYVVGDNPQIERAVVWEVLAGQVGNVSAWQAKDLNEITDVRDTDFIVLKEATGVNTMGWIAGWGELSGFPAPRRAFVLVPISGPNACLGDITGPLGVPNGVIGVPDLLEMLSKWGACPNDPDVPCWADLDGSGMVGVPDLLLLLANWGYCPGNCATDTLLTFEEEMTSRGISAQRWADFLDVLADDPKTEQDRWICWLERYLNGCTQCRPCRGSDPFAQ